ncbi:MAG: hypothetical protein ICV66_07405 [Chitinophagaceae bacterium]|nr:hypothetical protein [Chitinophagaceae bacterium]
MNNSDLIAALSLAITAIIFLVQTDDGLLKLKTRRYERWMVGSLLVLIVLLIYHQIFERFNPPKLSVVFFTSQLCRIYDNAIIAL